MSVAQAVTSQRYRTFEAVGLPREMGRQIGEGLRQEIQGFCNVALQRVNKTIRVSRETAIRVAQESLPFAQNYAPDAIEELRGMAEGANVSLLDLMLLQIRNQLQPDQDHGCTSLSFDRANARATHSILAQNWDNDPALDPFTVVLTRRPANKPAFMNLTQAGLIAYIGISEAGMGVCLNTLPAPSRTVGTPHYFTVRKIYESTSLEQAVAHVEGAERAIPANIMLATPQGPADLEVHVEQVRVLHPRGSQVLTHANHHCHPDSQHLDRDRTYLMQSNQRQTRIDEQCQGDQARSLEGVQAMLRDHQGYPFSICRHENDDPLHGFCRTVFSVVIEVEPRRMHVSRGNPCEHPYEVYELN